MCFVRTVFLGCVQMHHRQEQERTAMKSSDWMQVLAIRPTLRKHSGPPALYLVLSTTKVFIEKTRDSYESVYCYSAMTV